MKQKIFLLLFMSVLLITCFSPAGFAAPTSYYPSSYSLVGSTSYSSGSVTDLQSNNGVYMVFRSYQSNTSGQALYAHSETATIGGLSYYLSKLTSADVTGTSLSNSTSSTGRRLLGKFVYSLAGVSSIPASTWTIYYRSWLSATGATCHDDIDVIIRQSNGAIRTTVATGVANSPSLTTTQQTLSATYSWSAYTVANQTDYLEIDYYVHVTTSASRTAYLRIDDNTLGTTSQTRATNVYLPSEYTSEVEFLGSSDTNNWTQLVWTVDSAWTAASVSVTIQLYNYTLGGYPTSGDGYLSYTSSATPSTDETKSQTIATNPTQFRDGTGNWRLKIKGAKSTTSQFDFRADFVQLIYVDTTLPVWSNAGTNNTVAGQPTLFYAYWSDNVGLSGYIFGSNNTGNWANDTWTQMSGLTNWSNITKTLNSTASWLSWRVWTNDTSNNWNDTGIISFKVFRPPVASFTSSPPAPYTGDTVTFDASASYDPDGTITTYFWTFGDGTNATGMIATHVYANNGVYVATLKVTDNDTLTDTTTRNITVLDRAPVASFTVSQSTVPTGTAVNFNASASYDPDGSIVSYFWAFGDGTNGTGITTSHTYADNGTYTVTLTVTDDDGTTGTANATETVTNRPPVASFTSSPSTPYTGDVVTFNASASYDPDGTIVSYFWTFGDGANATGITASHAYVENGTYTVTLTVTDNDGSVASTSAAKTVLNRPPVASFTSSPSTPYTGDVVTFNASASYDPDGTIASYFWTFGDGTNGTGVVVTHSYADNGTYTVILAVTDNDGSVASTSAAKTVLNRSPVASFTASATTVNKTQVITFNASASYDPDGTIVNYSWTFGDGTNATGMVVTHSYVNAGNYTVTLTVTDNDNATSSTSIVITVVNQSPVADFTPSATTVNTGDVVTFNASASYDPDGTIVSYFWTFGDGANATGVTTTHSYVDNGTYTVTLKVTDNDGATNTKTTNITVLNRPPVASFTSSPSTPYTSDVVTFNASASYDPDGTIVSYSWTFGDGTNATGVTVTHSYVDNGTYTVTLTVTDNDGATASTSAAKTILNRSPVASFTSSPSTPYTGDVVTFNASASSDPDGTITSYFWTFGDGTNATGVVVTHAYVENGTYTVTLTVTDNDGATANATATKTILNRSPVAIFSKSASTVYTGDSVTFNASSSYDPDGTIVSYSWTFGDGTNATGVTVTHSYVDNGTYTVTLTVKDNDGATATNTTTLTVLNRSPVASFTSSPTTPYTGSSVTFNASTSYDPDGTIVSYFWTFGDGTNGTGMTATHSYVENGTYTVTLTVTDNDGATASTSAAKTVLNRSPVASFTSSPSTPYTGDVVTFNASASSDPDGTIVSYFWTFGDGANGTGVTTTHSYVDNGTYTVTLTVTDNDGATSSTSSAKTVLNRAPVASFTASATTVNKTQVITFNASASYDLDGTIVSYFWTFGDGANATGMVVTHSYVNAGNYTVTLTVTDNDDATSSTSIVITVVNQSPVADFTPSATTVNTGDVVTFNASASYDLDGTIVSYFWTFGDGANATGVTTSHSYVDNGTYTVTLKVTDNDGATNTKTTNITVLNRPPVASFTSSATSVLTNVAVTFNASASYDPDGTIVSYFWTFGDGTNATGVTVSHSYADNGTYVVTLTITDNDSAQSFANVAETVLNRPPIASFTSSPLTSYTSDIVTFNASSSTDPDGTIVSYFWTFGDGANATGVVVTHAYVENGTYTVTVTVTDNDGSAASTSAAKTVLNRPPVASFTSSPPAPYTSDTVTFNASASYDPDGNLTSYFWAFGDGTNATGMVVSHAYVENGTYTVTLTVTDNDGSTASTSAGKAILDRPPVASFTSSPPAPYTSDTVTFNASASYDPDGNLTSYFWVFGDGTNATGMVVTHAYAENGNYTVTLTVTDNDGSTASAASVKTIWDRLPVASFTSSPPTPYTSDTVTFSASASYDPDGTIVSYFWTFGDGTNGTGLTTNHAYVDNGTYTVTLTVTDNDGSVASASTTKTVLNRSPVASFTDTASTALTNVTIYFNAASSYDPDGTIASYFWTFGDGTNATGVTASHAYMDNGTFIVTLTVTDNDGSTASATATKTIMDRPPVASFTSSPSAPYTLDTVTFDASSSYDPDGTIATYSWAFGDGTYSTDKIATHSYVDNGNYTVTLTVTDNDGSTASTSATKTILNRPPVASFTSSPSNPRTIDVVTFNASASRDTDGTVVSYFWTFGDGANGTGMIATHSYALNGTYTVTLTVTDNDGSTASTSATKTILNSPPVATFTASPSTVNKGQPATFNASASYDPDGTIVSYFWTFGDGTNATGQVVSHSYANEGNYTVTLTVTDNYNATSSTSLVETVGNQPPVAILSVSASTVYKNDSVFFNASASYDPDGTITSYSWTFGDGINATGVTATHAYVNKGVYTVTLKVTDNGGLTNTATKNITVLDRAPIASFTVSASTVPTGTAVNFNASASYDPDGSIVSYSWNFGDGVNSTGITTSHSYADNGTYLVTCTVTDDDGSTSAANATVTVLNRPPIASFTDTASTALTNVTIYFNATSSYDPDGTIASYFWTFGDGTNATGVTTNHAYMDNGTYTVTLTVTDNDGATASANATKIVQNRPPVVVFTSSPLNPYTSVTVTFNASASYDPDGTIVSYFWTFGDGTNGTGMTVTHSYVENGTYTVTLTVTDNDGAIASTSAAETVLNRLPVASFTSSPLTPYTSDVVTFNASASYDPDGTIVSYFWTFGDGTNATGMTASHAYIDNGTYTVTLIVTDNDGATGSTSVAKTVLNRSPVASFTASATTVNKAQVITFNASASYDPDGTIVSYFWTFGDGTNTTGIVVTHAYVNGGNYTVTLTVTDNDNAASSTSIVITVVNQSPVANFTTSATTVYTADTVTFNASASYDPDGTIVSYFWTFSDGANATGVTVSHSYADNSTYTVTLKVTDNDGATNTKTTNITVLNRPPVASFTSSPSMPYTSDVITFSASASSDPDGTIVSYFWTFGDGANGTGVTTTHSYVDNGTYTVTLKVTDNDGATNTTTASISVLNRSPVASFTSSATSVLTNVAVTFNASASYDPDGTIVSYFWTFGDGTNATGVTVSHSYVDNGTYVVTLKVTDNDGAQSSTSATETVLNRVPVASFTSSPLNPYTSDTGTFNASASYDPDGTIVSYFWTFGDGTNGTGAVVYHAYVENGNYTVTLTVTDNDGATTSTSAAKTVLNRTPVASFVSSPSAPYTGDVVTFNASTSYDLDGTIVSYFWTFGDGSNATGMVSAHSYVENGTYTVTLTVTDNDGSSASTSSTKTVLNRAPVASFASSPSTPYTGVSVTFNASASYDPDGTLVSYFWTFGDGTNGTGMTVTHSYVENGTYTVALAATDNDGATASTSNIITILNRVPVASFTSSPLNPYTSDTVTFNASASYDPDGTIVSYSWAFGDGTNAIGMIAAHSYVENGNYTVTLTVTDNDGSTASATVMKTILDRLPVASFTSSPSTPYTSDVVTFNASASYDPDGTVVFCSWTFGDGTNAAGAVIYHAYAENGNYTVTLTVTDNDGSTASTSATKTVLNRPPVASFTASSTGVDKGQPVTFNASASYDPDGIIVSYFWTFGDGTNATGQVVSHAYANVGSYTVNLTVTDNDNSASSTSLVVTVGNKAPIASFTVSASTVYTNNSVSFNASSSYDPDGNITSYFWTFGDGTNATGMVVTHAYSNNGVYTATLKVTDNDGATTITTNNITVLDRAPIASFTVSASTVPTGTAVNFNASASYDPDGSIVSYSWNFGDGTNGTGVTVSHSYVENGTYTVTLTVTDDDSSTGTTSTTETVSNRPPVASFTSSPPAPYTGDTVAFNASASYDPDGTIVGYFWTFGDGTNATGIAATHGYSENGSYTVTLTVTDNDSATASTSAAKTILNRLPIANFTESAETVYTGDTISFNASGSYDPDGTIASYFWTFGDGTNTSGKVTSHSYVENGTYTVTLVVTDNDGATATTSASKTVLDRPPNATFNYSPASPIANEIVTLNASASYDPDGTVVRYVWNFGDGNVTNTTTSVITHKYTSYGNYSATLTVEDNDGSKTNATRNIVVRDYPTAAFTVTPSSPSKMQNVTFDASSTDPRGGVVISYSWDFGDGNKVNTTGQVIVHAYVATGNYTSTLTVTDSEGLSNNASRVVTVSEGYPVAIYTVSPHAAAVNQPVSFNGSASYDPDGYIISYIWNFGDGNVTSNAGPLVFHVYTATGNYTTTLTVTDSQGLTNTAVDSVTVTAGLPPTSSFTFSPNSTYMGDTVVFNASSSTPNGGVITSYKWDYGDGSPSVNNTNPTTTHVYTGAGDYVGTLTVVDSEGLSDTTTRIVTVNQAPVATFAYSSTIVNRTATFNASASNDPNGYIVNYVWNFGDGNVTTLSTPIIGHVYTGWGDYGVALTVVDNQGYTDTQTTTVHIADYPNASFTFSPSPQIAGEIVTFDASSSTPNGGVINSYMWNFGDGSTMTVPSPIIDHSYTSTGNYTVTLTVTDSEGLSDNESKTIRIRAYPVASFVYSPSAPNRNDTVTFNASSSVANDGTIINYNWNFGDGSPILNVTNAVATHTYSVGGNFTVALTVTNSGGLNNSVSSRILVGKIPVAVFTYSPSFPTANEVTTFNASKSNDPDGYIANYTWNFGDANITTVTSPVIQHVYAKEGNYTVTLRLTDNEGLTNTTVLNVAVRNYPTAAFTCSPDSPIAGRTATFDASSSSPNGGVITSYQWNFGDGNITTSVDPIIIHTYSTGGNFTATLTVADSEGLSGSLSRTLKVLYPPVASFVHSPEPSYVGDIVTFNASQSYDQDGHIVNYTWDFGDGTPVVVQNPVTTHMYITVENYTSHYAVTLTATDNDGVNSTSSSILTVFKAPVAVFDYSPDFPIFYESVVFNASGSYSARSRYIVNYTWSFGDGNMTTTTNPILNHTYPKEGNYTVRLNVTDNGGFADSILRIVRIRNYPTAIFEYSPSNPLVDNTIAFDASVSSPNGGVILNYTWNFGDANTTTTTSSMIYHAYTLIGNYGVTLTVVDSEGLSSLVSKTVEISPKGPTAQYTVSPSPPKPSEVTTFDASMSTLGWNGTYHPPIISYTWDFGDRNITTVTSSTVTHIFTQEGDYVVTLTVVDSNGLTGQLSRVYHVSSGREDVNGDGKVDMLDISLAIDAFMTSPDHPLWDPRCDVNRDGFVDMADLSLIIMAFGTGW